jgi:hypothetical protein
MAEIETDAGWTPKTREQLENKKKSQPRSVKLPKKNPSHGYEMKKKRGVQFR